MPDERLECCAGNAMPPRGACVYFPSSPPDFAFARVLEEHSSRNNGPSFARCFGSLSVVLLLSRSYRAALAFLRDLLATRLAPSLSSQPASASSNMRASLASSSLFLSFLAPALAAANTQIPLSAPEQLLFDSPALRRVPPSTRPHTGSSAQPMFPSRPNPSVVVAVVDVASPTTSSVIEPSMLAEADEAEDDQEDKANFGAPCTFEPHSFRTCGDFYDEVSGVDHGLFCSPSGICAGKGAACGASEACDDGALHLAFAPPRMHSF